MKPAKEVRREAEHHAAVELEKARSASGLAEAFEAMLLPDHLICANCAANIGGIWPGDVRGEFVFGTCDLCAQVLGVSDQDNWDWPDSGGDE